MFEDAKHITDLMREEKTATGEARYKARRRFSQELQTRAALVAMGFKRADAVSALATVRDALTAKRVTYFQKDGIVTDQRVTKDHRVRLAAADAIFQMVPGVKAPQETLKPSGEITVEVVTLAPDGTKTAVRVHA
jgi:hypothetical protein